MHNYVDFGVCACSPDVSCNHLDIVNNACKIELHAMELDSLEAAPTFPEKQKVWPEREGLVGYLVLETDTFSHK